MYLHVIFNGSVAASVSAFCLPLVLLLCVDVVLQGVHVNYSLSLMCMFVCCVACCNAVQLLEGYWIAQYWCGVTTSPLCYAIVTVYKVSDTALMFVLVVVVVVVVDLMQCL